MGTEQGAFPVVTYRSAFGRGFWAAITLAGLAVVFRGCGGFVFPRFAFGVGFGFLAVVSFFYGFQSTYIPSSRMFRWSSFDFSLNIIPFFLRKGSISRRNSVGFP